MANPPPVPTTAVLTEVRTEHIHVKFWTTPRGRMLYVQNTYLSPALKASEGGRTVFHPHKESSFTLASCVSPQIVTYQRDFRGEDPHWVLYLQGSYIPGDLRIVRGDFDSIKVKKEYMKRAIEAILAIGNQDLPEIPD